MQHLERMPCHCGCGANRTDPQLMPAIAKVEAILGYELELLSGCRCAKHNADEGGKPKSEHLVTEGHWECRGVDVRSYSKDDAKRKAIVDAAKKAGFTGFGYAATFLHMDLGRVSEGCRPRFWYYADGTKHPATSVA